MVLLCCVQNYELAFFLVIFLGGGGGGGGMPLPPQP